MKFLLFILTANALGAFATRASPREMLTKELGSDFHKDKLAVLNKRTSYIVAMYRDMCDYESVYCIESKMCKPTVTDKVTNLLDNLISCQQMQANSSSTDVLCEHKCFYGAAYTKHCKHLGKKTRFSSNFEKIFEKWRKALYDFMRNQLDLFSGSPRSVFHLSDLFTSGSDSVWTFRTESMGKFIFPYSPLLLVFLSVLIDRPIWRFISSVSAMIGVVMISSITSRGWLPCIYAFGVCAFSCSDHSNNYVKAELFNGFAVTVFGGLVTVFCPNWFFRGSIQMVLGAYSLYSLFSIGKRVHQYANNLGIFFIRCFSLIIMTDMVVYLISEMEFFNRNFNSIELSVMVLTGYSKLDGTLMRSLMYYFDDLEMMMEDVFGEELYLDIMNLFPFGISVVQNFAVYFCLLSFVFFRTMFGILPIFLSRGFGDLTGDIIIRGFVFGHATIFRSVEFTGKLVKGVKMDDNLLYYNYVQLLLIIITLWSCQDFFMLNLALSLVLFVFTDEKSDFRNLDLMFSLKFVVTEQPLNFEKCEDVAKYAFLRDVCGLFGDRGDEDFVTDALVPLERTIYLMDGKSVAFPVDGAGPWVSIRDISDAADAYLKIQFGNVDSETGKVVIRQAGSGSVAYYDGELCFFTIAHNITGMTHLNVIGEDGTFQLEIRNGRIISFVPTIHCDVVDLAVAIRLTKEQAKEFHKCCPSSVPCKFNVYNGDVNDIKAVVVISGDGTRAVNNIQAFMLLAGFLQLPCDLKQGDSGTLVFCVGADGMMYLVAAVSHGYTSKNQASCAALISFCDRVPGLQASLSRRSEAKFQLSQAMEMMVIQYALSPEMKSADKGSQEGETSLSSVPEIVIKANLPLDEIDPFFRDASALVSANNLKWPSTIQGDVSMDDFSFDAGNDHQDVQAQHDREREGWQDGNGYQGGNFKGRRKNWRKDRARDKQGGFMSHSRLSRSDPIVQACVSVFDLSNYTRADAERIWKAFNDDNGLRGFAHLPHQGEIIAFNRKRRG